VSTTRISRKNQITLPVNALDAAGFEPGEVLRVVVDRRNEIRLVPEEDPFEAMIGEFPGISAATDLEALRNEWDR
jgi:bifunctional DNA-binding transcriptional regulator/antitoxin component of YhaV-PrlF toxin-antitoxin module